MKTALNDKIIIRNSGFFSTYIDKNLVLLNSQKSEYYDLDPIAADIWEKISVPQTISALLNHLVATYEGDPEMIEADMKIFLNHMQVRDMIRFEVL